MPHCNKARHSTTSTYCSADASIPLVFKLLVGQIETRQEFRIGGPLCFEWWGSRRLSVQRNGQGWLTSSCIGSFSRHQAAPLRYFAHDFTSPPYLRSGI